MKIVISLGTSGCVMCQCFLEWSKRHPRFLLFVGRVASDIWELGDGRWGRPYRRWLLLSDVRLVAAGSSRWMYNLLSTGRGQKWLQESRFKSFQLTWRSSGGFPDHLPCVAVPPHMRSAFHQPGQGKLGGENLAAFTGFLCDCYRAGMDFAEKLAILVRSALAHRRSFSDERLSLSCATSLAQAILRSFASLPRSFPAFASQWLCPWAQRQCSPSPRRTCSGAPTETMSHRPSKARLRRPIQRCTSTRLWIS